MRKMFFFAALGLSAIVQAVELDYYKTLIDEQADATKGQTQLYTLDYYADGSLLLLSSYQTTSADEPGLHFSDHTYQGGTASKWGSREGDVKFTNMRNSFLAKLDANGDLLWARPDTTGDYDLAGTAAAVTKDGGVIYADKFRTRKGRYMSFINWYGADGNMIESNNITFSTVKTASMTAEPLDCYAWAGVAQAEDSTVYLAGYQADSIFPTWQDTIAMRSNGWDGSSSTKSSNCNTVIIRYSKALKYVGYTINNDELVYDRPTGLHYENGKLYVAGTYSNGTESGIYAARYDKDLNREYIQYHPINGSLQFQETKFADGKIFVCGGLAKGSITVGDKTLATNGTFNHGLIYVMSMEDGSFVNAAVRSAANDALNITVAAYPVKDGYVAYNHETLNGISSALNYDEDLNLLSIDTLATGGGSSTISVVGRSADGNRTAVGLRARTTADYYLLNEAPMNFADKTNWYSVVAVLNESSEEQAINNVQRDDVPCTKVIENGVLYLMFNGTRYNVQGQVVR